jgi:hypothetical protein
MVIRRHGSLATFLHSNVTRQGSRVAQSSRLERRLPVHVEDNFPTELLADESGEEDEAGYDGEASVAGTETSRGSLTSVD